MLPTGRGSAVSDIALARSFLFLLSFGPQTICARSVRQGRSRNTRQEEPASQFAEIRAKGERARFLSGPIRRCQSAYRTILNRSSGGPVYTDGGTVEVGDSNYEPGQ